jgi:DNA-binding transcriptional ArsR family regulator
MTAHADMTALEPIGDPARAELLLHPLRQKILSEARRASTAAEIARRVGLPPQKVNYHVRTLVEAGFLRPAGEGRKRNLIEKRYRATARTYLLLPQVLGETSPGNPSDADRFSATHLLELSALLQRELGSWLADEASDGARVPTLSIDAEVRFDSSEQRAAFAEALQKAITDTIGRHTTPAREPDGRPRSGRAFRLVLGCYPVPDEATEDGTSDSDHRDHE